MLFGRKYEFPDIYPMHKCIQKIFPKYSDIGLIMNSQNKYWSNNLPFLLPSLNEVWRHLSYIYWIKKKNGLTAIKFSLKAKVWCTTELPLESWVRKTWICHFFLFPPLMFFYLCLWLHCWGIVWEWIHLFPHLSSHKGMRNTRASASFHLKGNNN